MYFCLNCIFGKEEETRIRITNLLERTVEEEFLVWFPKKEVKEKRQGKYETVNRPMFSNYLFIYWDGEKELDFPFLDIARMPTYKTFNTCHRRNISNSYIRHKKLEFLTPVWIWKHRYQGGTLLLSK